MEIIEIKDIVRKASPIYYRMFYGGTAVIKILNKIIESRIDFSIETKPTGEKSVLLTVNDTVDYPLVPLRRSLKQRIHSMDHDGSLPF
ncbi:MAG: hypothetical protein LBQ77_02270 [Treponema sp.]|jgi:hypothetical protein|nr:hypothetical protein [Treponema sp.]